MEPVGVLLPLRLGLEGRLETPPRTTSPRLGSFQDNTSTLSVGQGVEAVVGESLFISDESKEPSDEDTSRRAQDGLHNHIQRKERECNKTYHELLWCPDTYDFARGFSLGNHSSPL